MKRYKSDDDDNFSQVRVKVDLCILSCDISLSSHDCQVTNFWTNVLTVAERERLVQNVASSAINAADFIQQRVVCRVQGKGVWLTLRGN